MSTLTPPEQPTRESLLSLLDSEIEGLQSEHSRSGWSLWAILASIVGALWLLTEQLSGASFNPTNVAKIFIAGVGLADVSYWFYKRLSLIPVGQEESRFSWIRSVVSGKWLRLISELIRSILCMLLASKLPLGWVFFIPFTITYSLNALISLAGLVLPFIAPRFTLQHTPPKTIGGMVGFNGFWLLMTIPLTISLFFIIRACPVPMGEAISEYRIGGLLVVITILLDLLLNVLAPSSRLQSLTDIRRKVVFNKINLDEAIIQTEIALGGMRAVDALRDSYFSVMFLLDKMDEQVANAELAQQSIVDVVSNLKGNDLTQEQFNTLSSTQRVVMYCLAERGKYYERIKEQLSDFDDRVKWILRGVPAEHETINQIYQSRRVRMESSDKRYFAMLDKQETIQERLSRLQPLGSKPKAIKE